MTNINIKIDKDQFVIIHGKSGAGKSTLLNLMGGLTRPSGTIRMGDKTTSEIKRHDN